MKAKTRFLADQREHLLRRAASERDDLADQLAGVSGKLRRIDSGLAVVERWLRSPLLIAVAATLLVSLGRRRGRNLKTVGAGLGLLTSALRARREMTRMTMRRD